MNHLKEKNAKIKNSAFRDLLAETEEELTILVSKVEFSLEYREKTVFKLFEDIVDEKIKCCFTKQPRKLKTKIISEDNDAKYVQSAESEKAMKIENFIKHRRSRQQSEKNSDTNHVRLESME